MINSKMWLVVKPYLATTDWRLYPFQMCLLRSAGLLLERRREPLQRTCWTREKCCWIPPRRIKNSILL